MPYFTSFERDLGCRPELREAVAAAQKFMQRYSGKGWLSAWLTASGDQAELQALDAGLKDAMTGFFQVCARACVVVFTQPMAMRPCGFSHASAWEDN